MPRHCRTCRNGKSKLCSRRHRQRSGSLPEQHEHHPRLLGTRRVRRSLLPRPFRALAPRRGSVDRTLHRRLFQAWRELRSGILGRGVQRSRKGRPRQGEAVSVSEGLDGIKLGRRSDLSGREVLSRTGRLLSPTSAAPHDGVSHLNMRGPAPLANLGCRNKPEIGGSRPIRSPASRRRSPVAAQA